VLQCFAVFRSALQCIDVCGVLQCDAMWSRTQGFGKGTKPMKISWGRHKTARQYTITHTDTLQALQHAATHQYIHAPRFFGDGAEPLKSISVNALQHIAMHNNTLQHAATRCNTLQHAATRCNTLQHSRTQFIRNAQQYSATRCNTLQHTATFTHPIH